MKTYEKPMLVVLNLNGNDRLCGDCADNGFQTIQNNEDIKNELLLFGDTNGDNELSREEALVLFAPEDGCANPVGIYCKFHSVGGKQVAWS